MLGAETVDASPDILTLCTACLIGPRSRQISDLREHNWVVGKEGVVVKKVQIGGENVENGGEKETIHAVADSLAHGIVRSWGVRGEEAAGAGGDLGLVSGERERGRET
jgi:hypothetical protein